MRLGLAAGMGSGVAVAPLDANSLLLPGPDHPGLRPSSSPDGLAIALERTEWGMSVTEVRDSFDICSLSRDQSWKERSR